MRIARVLGSTALQGLCLEVGHGSERMQVVVPLLTMLTKEIDASASAAAVPVCEALLSECRDRLDVMAAKNETAFLRVVRALHAQTASLGVAHAPHAELGASEEEEEEELLEEEDDDDDDFKMEDEEEEETEEEEEEDDDDVDDEEEDDDAEGEEHHKLASLYAKQAVFSRSHATRFLFATLALAMSQRDAGAIDVSSTVCQQLLLALSHGVPAAIGEALGEMLLTVCSAAASDLSRACRRILLKVATGALGPGAVVSYALDLSWGTLTPVPYRPQPAAQCEPGLLFAAQVDVTTLAALRGEESHVNLEVYGAYHGSGAAVVSVAKRPEGEARGHVPDVCGVGVQLQELPLECKLPAVGCLVRQEEAAAFLGAPVTDWKKISEGLRDDKGHRKAAWFEVSELNRFAPSVRFSLAPGARVLLLHAHRA